MKKILNYAFLLVFLTGTTMSYAQSTGKTPPGWATATVDAGGALAGGVGVLQVTGGVAATNPWGWAATGLGAVIGGAAASVGFHYGNKTTNATISDNPKNDLNMIGTKHNEIVIDYFKYIKDDNVTVDNYMKYLETQLPDVYTDVKGVITTDYLIQQKKEIEGLQVDADFINWTLSKLPSDVNKDDFKAFLTEYKDIVSKDDAVKYITDYENKLIASADLKKESIELLKYYFATLRNSTVLW